MVQYKLMFDASVPPDTAPSGYSAVAGYIGGDTPHVWDRSEWARFTTLKKLPVFVRSNPVDANQAAIDAADALHRLNHLGVPRCAVVLDLEAAVNQAYVSAFNKVIQEAKYILWLYGQASTVFANTGANGYWAADWTGSPYVYNHPGVRATQYADGTMLRTNYDASTIKLWDYYFDIHRKWAL